MEPRTLKMEAWRLKMEAWRVCRPVIVDSYLLDEEQDPDSRIRIEMKSCIQIRIPEKSWVRILIKGVMRIRNRAYLSVQNVRDV